MRNWTMFRSEVNDMEFDKSKILTVVTADQAKIESELPDGWEEK